MYSVADIVSITGIKAHTLRKWESRYGFITPNRTETNIRYYTDDQLRKLLNVGILLRNGYKVSRIDALSEEELHQSVSEILLEASPQDDINALIIAMLEMKEAAFNEIWEKHSSQYGLLKTVTQLLYPFLNHVGVLWGTNRAMPAQEHFISNLIKQKLLGAVNALPSAPKGSRRIVLFLMEGENHEIGLILAYYIAKKLGWHVYYLGQNVPTRDLTEVLRITEPELIMTMYTIIRPDNMRKNLEAILKTTEVPLLISGDEYVAESVNDMDQVRFLQNPEAFIEILKNTQSSKGRASVA